MMFLNPLALLALAAAAIPILVHLFNFRRPRKIDFSSLVFLRELERSAMQRMRIRQWLLLALRTLAIACLVLAFSRPSITGPLAGFIGSSGPRAVAIVLDNSLSMTVGERQGDRLRIAKDAAMMLAAEADPNDQFFVITTSGEVEPTPGPLTRSTLGEAVARISAGPQIRTLDRAIARAADRLEASDLGAREVIVVSDFQASMLEDTVDVASVDDVRVALIGVGSRIPSNISVERVEVVSRVIDDGRPARVDARIRNHGPEVRSDAMVSLYLEDERIAEAVVELPANGSADVSFEAVPRSRGWLRGRLEVDDPSFEADNVRHFVLFVPERRRLLIVRGGGADSRYAELALSPDLAEGRLVFERDVISAAALGGQALGSYDAVLLLGAQNLPSGQASLLAQYVEDGGGLLITPGSDGGDSAVNGLLAAIGGGRLESRVGSLRGERIASIDRIEVGHPLFEGVFEGREGIRAEQPDVFATHRYAPGGAAEQSIMWLSNGWPFMQELRYGAGTVLMMTSSPDPAWTELAVRGLFVPLMYRSAFFLSAADAAGVELTAGGEAIVTLRSSRSVGSVLVVLPDGTEAAPEQRTVLGTTRVTLGGDMVSRAGFVEVLDGTGGSLLRRIPVNLDHRESEPELATVMDAARLLSDRLGVDARPLLATAEGRDMLEGVATARRGVEIWNVFLLLALAFLVAETLVSRRWKAPAVAA
jgi:hypothetical protein